LIAITGDSDGAPDATIDSWFNEIKNKGLVGTVFLLGDRGHSISNYKHHDGMEFGTHNWKGSETYCTAKQRVIDGGFPTPLSNRNHGLYWSNLVDDPKEMEECGIQFDSNMETGLIDPPYTTGVYSFGTTLPYYFFDIDGSMINLLEIPQYYQDWFYIMQSGGGASNINAQQMEGSFDKIYSDIKNFKGVGTLNLHQIYVGFGNYLTFFRYALDKLSKDDVVVWTMGDIGNWWKSRDEISLTQETQNSFVINSQISIDDIPFLTTSTKIKFDGTEENCEKHMTIFEREWCAYILKVSAGSHTLKLK
jgi:hypothetical protein